MKHLLLFVFSLAGMLDLTAQKNYAEAIRQGDEAFRNGQFKIAIDKYLAAEAFDPGKKEVVNAKVKLTFNRIEALRQEANRLKMESDRLLEEVIFQKKFADNALIKAEEQAELARAAKEQADSLAKNAEEALENFKNLKETVIGSRFQGGIVIAWNDSTGKHGVVAAEKDIGAFSWEKARDTCLRLQLNGYDDWRLPNRTELAVMFANKNMVGGFEKDFYWSDTVAGFLKLNAWCQLFSSGFLTGKGKGKIFLVRPVRDFQK